jgi:copper chaperone
MIKLNIPDMSCGHCAGVITSTLKGIDPDAQITIDVAAHSVELKTSQSLELVYQALAAAGYPATAA